MYSSTTRIDIYGIPYWFLVLLPALWIAGDCYFFRRRVSKSSSANELTEPP